MTKRLLPLALLLSLTAPAVAHHGWSSYDASKTISHTATLSDVKWGNPHGSAKVSYKGKVRDVILAPVARMKRAA